MFIACSQIVKLAKYTLYPNIPSTLLPFIVENIIVEMDENWWKLGASAIVYKEGVKKNILYTFPNYFAPKLLGNATQGNSHKQTNKQTNKHTNKQTNKQTNEVGQRFIQT